MTSGVMGVWHTLEVTMKLEFMVGDTSRGHILLWRGVRSEVRYRGRGFSGKSDKIYARSQATCSAGE